MEQSANSLLWKLVSENIVLIIIVVVLIFIVIYVTNDNKHKHKHEEECEDDYLKKLIYEFNTLQSEYQ